MMDVKFEQHAGSIYKIMIKGPAHEEGLSLESDFIRHSLIALLGACGTARD
jgi:hypothetical protein